MNKLWKRFLAWLNLRNGTVTQPTPTPTPAPTPTLADAIDISGAKVISKYNTRIPAIPITRELSGVKISGGKVSFAFDDSGWPASGEPATASKICVVWQDGAELVCGEFDAVRPRQRTKGLENVTGDPTASPPKPPYINGRMPSVGAPVWFVIYRKDGSERTNVCAGGAWQ